MRLPVIQSTLILHPKHTAVAFHCAASENPHTEKARDASTTALVEQEHFRRNFLLSMLFHTPLGNFDSF